MEDLASVDEGAPLTVSLGIETLFTPALSYPRSDAFTAHILKAKLWAPCVYTLAL